MARSFFAGGRGRRSVITVVVGVTCAISASSLRAAPATTVVPRVSGGVGAAYARLHDAGLLVTIAGGWTFASGATPLVTRTVPAAGAVVAPGTAVTLDLTSAGRPASLLPRRAPRLALPSFFGERVSAASRWAAVHHLSFRAHLGPLRRGGAARLLLNFVVVAQFPRPGRNGQSTLSVWGRQPAAVLAAKPPPPPPPPPPPTYYQDPVSSDTFADPFVLDNGSTHSDYWAFSTGDRFPVLHSTDLVNWKAEPPAMTSWPSWVVTGDWHPWAPSVIQISQPCPATGPCYVMYYVGANASVSASAGWLVNCIGVATATQPGGPYTDQGPLTLKDATAGAKPIGCGDDTGESNIDPSPFLDPSTGNAYLYVSTERGEVAGGQYVRHSTVSVIPLDPGLLTASGPRVPLLTGDANTWEDGGPAEGPTVEGPFMELHNGTYYLFYSGGNWTLAYGMGYATGQGPAGPFTKSPANPILAETPTVFSPGGGDRLVTGPHGGLWLVYHARANSRYEPRTLRIDPLSWKPAADAADPDVPAIAGPTSTPQSVQP